MLLTHRLPRKQRSLDTSDNTLNIKIRATDGSEVFFKIKKTTKLNKLKVRSLTPRPFATADAAQNAYADRVGQDPGAIRYVHHDWHRTHHMTC